MIWYTFDDFEIIKKQYRPTVKKMARGRQLSRSEESRGLEQRTPAGDRLRQENQYFAVDAVLTEQE